MIYRLLKNYTKYQSFVKGYITGIGTYKVSSYFTATDILNGQL